MFFTLLKNCKQSAATCLLFSGCDGTSGCSQYNQVDKDGNEIDQRSLLGSYVSVVALLKIDDGQNSKELYFEPLANSDFSIKVLRLCWEKETNESSKLELARIKADIEELQGTTYVSQAFPKISFKFCVHLSKVCVAISILVD